MSQHTLAVTILDKEYHFACPPEEQAALLEAARILNNMMVDIRKAGVGSFDRIAIMAALNLSHEALKNRSTPQNGISPADVDRITYKIDHCLENLN